MATRVKPKRNPGLVGDAAQVIIVAVGGLWLWNAYKAKQLPGQ